MIGLTTHPGKYEEVGAEIGRLVDKKQQAYGRSFETCEKALALLCPDKLRADQYGLALAFARSWDKWSRLFSDPTAFGEEPKKDLAGYALLMNGDLEVTPRGGICCEPSVDSKKEFLEPFKEVN